MSRGASILLAVFFTAVACKAKTGDRRETPRSVTVLPDGAAAVLVTTTRGDAVGYGAAVVRVDANGRRRWRRDLWVRSKTQRTRAKIATAEDDIVAFFGSAGEGTRVVLLDGDGEITWSIDVPEVAGLFEAAFLTDDVAVLVTSLAVLAVERRNGAVRWVRPVHNVASAALIRDGTVVVRGRDLRVTLFSTGDGRMTELESGCIQGEELASIESSGDSRALVTTHLSTFEQRIVAPVAGTNRVNVLACHRAGSSWNLLGRVREGRSDKLVAFALDTKTGDVSGQSETGVAARIDGAPIAAPRPDESVDVQVAGSVAWVFDWNLRTWRGVDLEEPVSWSEPGDSCLHAKSGATLTSISRRRGQVRTRPVERDSIVATAGGVMWVVSRSGAGFEARSMPECPEASLGD